MHMTLIIPTERAEKRFVTLARFAIFLVYGWFGILKVFDLSPATPLVHALFDQTLARFVSFEIFNVAFGLFEVLIGILFLIPRLEKIAAALLALHMITTMLPLVILPSYVWAAWFVPTLEGQYIIKNVLIITAAIGILVHTMPSNNTSLSSASLRPGRVK